MATATDKKRFGREVKIGATLVGLLLVTFSALLVRRMMSGAPAPPPDLAFAPATDASSADAPGGATLIRPEPFSNAGGDPTMPGPAATDSANDNSYANDPASRAPMPSARIAAAAYEQADDQPAAASARRRPPFGREQDDYASQPPAALDPAVYDPPITETNPPGAAPAAMMAGDPSRNGDPNGFAPTAPMDATPIDQGQGQSYAGATDPGAAAPLQPLAGSAAFRDTNAAVDNSVPVDNSPSAYNANPGYSANPDYNAASADSAVPPQLVERGAVQAAGRAAIAGGYDPPAASGEPGKYVVQPNDNYWTISQKVYGAGAFFKALQQFNGDGKTQASRLQVGDVVAVPPTAVLRQKFPDLCPKPRREQAASQTQPVSAGPRQRLGATVYVVEQGDSLFDIARHQLGKASRWVEIYDLNRDALGDDFHYLRPGTELVMPSNGSGSGPGNGQPTQDVITRQRGDSIQR